MWSLLLDCPQADKDKLSALLWEAGTSGIIERDLPCGSYELEAFFERQVEIAGLENIHPRWCKHPGADWVEISRAMWEPCAVGERFYLVPEWRDDPAPPGRLRLRAHAGTACGTGYHAATQLALEAMEQCSLEDRTVVDLGTGSGILAEAAALLGARLILACDIDFEAVQTGRRNLSDRCPAVHWFCGSVRALRDQSACVTVANINAAALKALFREIDRVTRNLIILSGFQAREANSLASLFSPETWHQIRWLERQNWSCVIARRRL